MRIGRCSLCSAIAAALFAAAGTPAPADTVTLKGVPAIKARDVEVKRGRLIYKIATTGRQQEKSLSRVETFTIDAYPSMAKAEQAIEKKQWARAASLLKTAYSRTSRKPELRLWVGRRRVMALDKAEKFEEAMELYLILLQKDASSYVRMVQPRNAPKDEKVRKKVVAEIDKSLQGADGDRKKHLQELKGWLASGGEAPAPVDNGGGASKTTARRAANVSEVKSTSRPSPVSKKTCRPRRRLWRRCFTTRARAVPRRARISMPWSPTCVLSSTSPPSGRLPSRRDWRRARFF